jgi:hypothetical protein
MGWQKCSGIRRSYLERGLKHKNAIDLSSSPVKPNRRRPGSDQGAEHLKLFSFKLIVESGMMITIT